VISADQKVLFAGHAWHAIEIVGVALVSLLGIWMFEGLRRKPQPRDAGNPAGASIRRIRAAEPFPTGRQPILRLVALAGFAAGAIHLAVMPEHFKESLLYGTFFLVSAMIQIGYSAWLLLRPSRSLLVVGAAGNLAIVLLWIITRTVAIPAGPDAGETEAFGLLDVLCSLCEVAMAVGALVLLYGVRRRAHSPNARTRPAGV
jgi:hypothetical protein